MQFYDFEWFSWFPIILLLIFNLWPTFQEIWSKWGKSNKTLICFLNHFSKVVNVFPQCNSMILSGLVDSHHSVTNFQFVTNISGDMIEMRKTLICFWITFKGCNAFPQCNSHDFEWFSWFPIPVTTFHLTKFQERWIEMRKIK